MKHLKKIYSFLFISFLFLSFQSSLFSKEIIIIGGGSIGLMNAYFLQKAGHEVTIIEKGEVSRETSFGNGGMLYSQIPPLSSKADAFSSLGEWLKKATRGGSSGSFSWTFRFDTHFWSWLRQFATNVLSPNNKNQQALNLMAAKSLSLHKEIDQEFNSQFIKSVGRIELYRSQNDLEQIQKESIQNKIQTQKLTLQELREMNIPLGSSVIGGLQFSNNASLDSFAYLSNLAKLLEQRGVKFLFHTEVMGFETETNHGNNSGKKRISALKVKIKNGLTSESEQTLQVNPEAQIIFATGPTTNLLTEKLGFKTYVEPAEGYHIMIKRPHNFPEIPIILNEDHIFIVPMGDQLRILAHLGLNGLSAPFNEKVVDGIVSSLKKHFAFPLFLGDEQELKILSKWHGYRPCTPDTLPIIEKLPKWENLTLTVGHCTHGIGLGPVTGFLVTQILEGNVESEWGDVLKFLKQDRF